MFSKNFTITHYSKHELKRKRNQLDDARDIRDLVKEVELSLVEAQRWARHRLLDQLNDILKLFADLLYRHSSTLLQTATNFLTS